MVWSKYVDWFVKHNFGTLLGAKGEPLKMEEVITKAGEAFHALGWKGRQDWAKRHMVNATTFTMVNAEGVLQKFGLTKCTHQRVPEPQWMGKAA